jgi:hypothetical protein
MSRGLGVAHLRRRPLLYLLIYVLFVYSLFSGTVSQTYDRPIASLAKREYLIRKDVQGSGYGVI